MDFQEKNKQQFLESEDDKYLQDIKGRLSVKKQTGVLGEDKLYQYYQSEYDDANKIADLRVLKSIQFWSTLTLFYGVSRLLYPYSVKFVKNKIGLQGYLNIHVAILPFIFIGNGIVQGIHSGLWQIYWFEQEINGFKQQNKQL